jgi:hypothetical protein
MPRWPTPTKTEKPYYQATIKLGSIDYRERGRADSPVEIEVILTRHNKATDLRGRSLTMPLDLSITGTIWQPGKVDCYTAGQCAEEIAAAFPGDEMVANIVAVWSRWHLNDMRAGCRHQQQLATRPEIGEPCPFCGYKYGTAWNFEPIPSAVVAEIKSWQSRPEMPPAASLETATAIGEVCDVPFGVTSTVTEGAETAPSWAKQQRWTVTLQYEKRTLTVPFYGGGAADPPTTGAVLRCLLEDIAMWLDTDDHYGWCRDMGMDPSRETEQQFAQIGRQLKQLRSLLGADYETIAQLDR